VPSRAGPCGLHRPFEAHRPRPDGGRRASSDPAGPRGGSARAHPRPIPRRSVELDSRAAAAPSVPRGSTMNYPDPPEVTRSQGPPPRRSRIRFPAVSTHQRSVETRGRSTAPRRGQRGLTTTGQFDRYASDLPPALEALSQVGQHKAMPGRINAAQPIHSSTCRRHHLG